MKGETILLNGDNWTIVDIAPAPELAEMVAVILEEEGFPVYTRGPDNLSDIYTHLGVSSLGTTFVLVPEADAKRAMALIAETVTDYEGDDLSEVIEQLALESQATDGELEDED